MDVSIGTSVAEFVGNFFKGGKVTAHVVGAHGRGTRPAVLLAAAAAAAVIAVASPAHAQMQGGIQIRAAAVAAPGYDAPPAYANADPDDGRVVSGGIPIRVTVVMPTRKLGSSTVNAVPVETVSCRAEGPGAITVIGNAVYCGNRTIRSGDTPDAYLDPGVRSGAFVEASDDLAAQTYRNLQAARRAAKR